MIRIMLIDRFPLVCAGIRSAIGQVSNMEIVCALKGVDGIHEAIRQHKPDVILLGIVDLKGSSLPVLKTINTAPFTPKVIVLSSSLYSEDVMESLRYGAHGYMGKEVAPEEIPAIINSVCEGNIVVSKYVSDTTQPVENMLAHISRREMEVLRLIGIGYSNKEISEKLFIGLSTTNTYVRRLIDKLQLRNRNDLLIYAASLPRSMDEYDHSAAKN